MLIIELIEVYAVKKTSKESTSREISKADFGNNLQKQNYKPVCLVPKYLKSFPFYTHRHIEHAIRKSIF